MAPDGRLSVVLADGHPRYRDGLARAIVAQPELSLVGLVGDGEAALRLITSRCPDVALVDIRLPGPGGLSISRELMKKEPALPTRVVIASTFSERPAWALDTARSVGAAGYLGKDASREQICEALIAAGRGQTWLTLDPAVGVVFPAPDDPAAGAAA